VLTGDHAILRADVLMDLGSSINPALDIGQIEGAFVQGMGCAPHKERRLVSWFTLRKHAVHFTAMLGIPLRVVSK